MLVAKKDYYLDADGKLTAKVEKGVTVVIRKGQEVLPEHKDQGVEGVEADQLPADEEADGEDDPDAGGADEDEAEHKQGAAPAQNKAGRPRKR